MNTELKMPEYMTRKYNCMTGKYEYIDQRRQERISADQARADYLAYLETNTQLQATYIDELRAAAVCLLITINCGKPLEEHWNRLSQIINRRQLLASTNKLIIGWYTKP